MIYAINRDGQAMGSYSREDVQLGVRDGQLFATDLAWIQKEQRWAPLSELLTTPVVDSFEDIALGAFVGAKYSTYYKAKWAQLDPQRRNAWNWPAFLAAPFWLAYRKLYAYAWGYFAVVAVFAACEIKFRWDPSIGSAVGFGLSIMIAWHGNYSYKEYAAERVRGATANDLPRLARTGGTSVLAVIILLAAFVVLEACVIALTN